MQQSSPNPDHTSRADILVLAAWFGILTGLVEGTLWLRVTHLHVLELAWVPLLVDLPLALLLALPILALRKVLAGRPPLFLRVAALYSGLMVFDWVRVRNRDLGSGLAWVIAIAGAAAITLIFRRGSSREVPRRSLPWLAILAVACVAGIPLYQHVRQARSISRLPAAAPGARNVLVIVIDTLRADHLSTYGYTRATSPNFDRLAAQGVLFENAMSPSSWTLPAHASLLTGLYPHQHGATYLGASLGPHFPTLGEAFQRLGYRTAGFSASTYFFSRRTGMGRGFIHFEDDFESPASAFPQTFYGERLEQVLYRLHIAKDRIGRRNARQISRHALRWMESDHRHPFFVFMNFYDAHDPYLPPEPYLHRFTKLPHPAGPIPQTWDWFKSLTPQQRQGEMDAYDGAIQYVDTELGEFFQQLHRRGLDDNTLVVITSDHGEEFNEHGFMDHLNALYRELIHVPLLFWEPGKVPAGLRITTPVSLVSLPATLLSLAQDRDSSPLPGVSIGKMWSNPDQNFQGMPVVSELNQAKLTPLFPNYYGPLTSLTTPRWHYISGGKAGEELFRCCANTPETDNLANTEEGKRMCREFKKELEFTAERPQVAAGSPATLAVPAP